jgi:hypothetical protein
MGTELNAIAKNLGLEPEIATTVYFRIATKTGNNMKPVYSNSVSVSITPYSIDMSIAFILNGDKESTDLTFASESDGIYSGFMGAVAWQGFFLQEGDGTVWGNTPTDGMEFNITSEAGSWNMWFPGQAGCYYVTVNTANKNWSALLLPTLSLGGEMNGTMIFDRVNTKWTYSFTATGVETKTITLSTTGKQYNTVSGTDDASAVDTPFALAQEGEKIVVSETPGNISISIPKAGDMTLTLDLSNPNQWKCEVIEGSSGPVEVKQELYVSGIDDGITGGWTFDNYLSLYKEDNLSYAGVFNVNSVYGYSLYTEKDNWDDKYALGEGDEHGGTLVFQGGNNIPAPAPDVYLLDVSLQALTYSLMALDNEIYVAGLNDDWSTFIPLTKQSAGVYSGSIHITQASEYGFQLQLINQGWDHKFGGEGGKLYYQGNNITDDARLSSGTYTLTVDLINKSYNINE